MSRDLILGRLRASPRISVLVIGGGINGLSVFRELALQGVDVVLAEKGDFCSGASAAPSRMVHGGLRYLENGEFGLVREALAERDRLLANAPHLVRPLPTTLPIFDTFSGLANGAVRFLGLSRRPGRRGAVAVKIGLSLYDFFARRRRMMPRHSFRGRSDTLRAWPALNPDVRFSTTYYDAWVSTPERLGVELLTDVLPANPQSAALNYASVSAEGGGLLLRDGLSHESVPIEPSIIVNATGGWIDRTNAALGLGGTRLIGGTKGSHLIVDDPALLTALNGHMIYYENEDGRICILFPYLGNVLIGSTDIRVDDPDTVRCEADERDYILQSLAFIFPAIRIRDADIVFQFSGVRPLPATGDDITGRIPRDHSCRMIERGDTAPPVLCMIGGKWTTFRSFGALAADQVLGRLGRARQQATDDVAIGGGRNYPRDPAAWIAAVASASGLAPDRVRPLFERYGTTAQPVAAFIAKGSDVWLPGGLYTQRELLWLIRNEFVEALGDLLLRRTTLAISGELTLDLIDAALDLLAEEKRWNPGRKAQERSTFLADLETRHGVRPVASAPDQQGTTLCA